MTDDTWDEASTKSAFVWWHTESADYGTYIPMTEEEASRIFDRVIRKVKAEAWDEAVDSASIDETEFRIYIYHAPNPYRD